VEQIIITTNNYQRIFTKDWLSARPKLMKESSSLIHYQRMFTKDTKDLQENNFKSYTKELNILVPLFDSYLSNVNIQMQRRNIKNIK
jgi:hypothetical protein